MNEFAAALEATTVAHYLKVSRWTYPLVNAGHILGLALLLGAVVPMDLRILGVVRRGSEAAAISLLRPFAALGFALAAAFGALLFATQAGDYVESGWFLAKMGVIALALLNVAAHLRLSALPPYRRRTAAALSLCLWPVVLVLGRMIAFG